MYNEDVFDRSLKMPLPTGKELIAKQKYTSGEYRLVYASNSIDVDTLMESLVSDYEFISENIDLTNLINKENLTPETLALVNQLKVLAEKYDIKLVTNPSRDLDLFRLEITRRVLERLEKGERPGMFIYKKHETSKHFKHLLNTVNAHNKYVGARDGIKNYATYQMHQVLNDPRNATTAYKSIDVAIEAFDRPIGDIRNKIIYNLDDGHTVSAITASGAVGSDGVGIAANGTKVLFSTLHYMSRAFAKDEPLTETELKNSHTFSLNKLVLPYIKSDGNKAVWRVNIGPIADTLITDGTKQLYFNILRGKEFLLDFINKMGLSGFYQSSDSLVAEDFMKRVTIATAFKALSEATGENLQYQTGLAGKLDFLTEWNLEEDYKKSGLQIDAFLQSISLYDLFLKDSQLYLYDRDAALAVGSLLSMAADNAKTLNLDKLNAKQDFFAMHLFLAMNGCPEEVIVQFFNSPVVQMLVNTSNQDLVVADKIQRLNEDHFKAVKSGINSDSTLTPKQKKDYLALLASIKTLWQCGSEITEVASILSINQGIKVEEEEIVKQKNNLNNALKNAFERRGLDLNSYKGDVLPMSLATNVALAGTMSYDILRQKIIDVNKLILDYNTAHPEHPVGVSREFSLDLFIKDSEYREIIKRMMDVVKFNINVFDIVDKAPHFKAMLQKYNELISGYTQVSDLMDYIVNRAPREYDSLLIFIKKADEKINDFDADHIRLFKNYNSIYTQYADAAWHQAVFERFLQDVVTKYGFKYNSVRSSKDGKQYVSNIECNFRTENSIQDFMKFMSSALFPALVSKNPESNFLQALTINQQEARENKNIYYLPLANLKLKLRKSSRDAVEFNGIKLSYDRFKDLTLSDLLGDDILLLGGKDLTVGDAIFIYNTLLKSSGVNGNNFDALLTDYEPSDLQTLHANFIRDIDTKKIDDFQVPPFMLMALLVKYQLKTRGGKDTIIFNKPLPNGSKSLVMTEYDKTGAVTFNRFTLSLPYIQPVDPSIALADKAIAAMKKGALSLNKDLSCKN